MRVVSQNRHLERLDRLERLAAPMVGELSSGLFYCFPVGGRYYQSTSHSAVVDYLIRNKHIN